MGQDDTNQHALEITKATAQPWYTLQRQQWYNTSTRPTRPQQHNNSGISAPALNALAFIAATVLLYLCMRSVHQEMDATNRDYIFTSTFEINHTSSKLILSSYKWERLMMMMMMMTLPLINLRHPPEISIHPHLEEQACTYQVLCTKSISPPARGITKALGLAGWHSGKWRTRERLA